MEDPGVQRSPTISNWIGGLLRNAPDYTPYGLAPLVRGLAPMFEGPSANEQQTAFDASQTGNSPGTRLFTPSPMEENIQGFSGNIYGVNPNRLRLWHGVRSQSDVPRVQGEGFTRGRSAEVHEPGTSMSTDPNLSYSGFAENDVNQMLRARANVDPAQVRNLSPGAYSATRLPENRPGQYQATSKPQSYYREAELFFPQASGGQSLLTDIRGLTTPEIDYLRRTANARSETNAQLTDYGRRTQASREHPADLSPNELEELATNAPTVAEGLRLMQQQANQVTRAGRPSLPMNTVTVANRAEEIPRYANRLMFPEQTGMVEDISMDARRLAEAYNTQRDLGRSIASGAGGVASTPPGPALTRKLEVLQERMNNQNTQYRDFTRGNERFITNLQGLQLPAAEEIRQRLTLRDMMRASGQEGGRPYFDVAEALVPIMERLNYTPAEMNAVLRGPYAQPLAGRSSTYAANTLREQRGNLR